MYSAVEHSARTRPAELRDQMVGAVTGATLERDPFCHIYMEGIFPTAIYPGLLSNLPPKEVYAPLNLRRWARGWGKVNRLL